MGLFDALLDLTKAGINTALIPVAAVKDVIMDDDSLDNQVEKVKDNLDDVYDDIFEDYD